MSSGSVSRIGFLLLLVSAVFLFCVPDMNAEDRYLVVNIIPGEDHRTVFDEVHRMSGGPGNGPVHIGIGAIFSYLDQPRDTVRKELLGFLALSEQYNIPVVVQLDGEQWWRNRPDLWNWWDPARPGYDPANRANVEWTGWGPEHAMKIAWRNWGQQIRVLPPPNFMSSRYREACHEEMHVFVPIVLTWRHHLPPEKKHLLIGIKLGWESAIGVNSFYLPGGNDLLDSAEVHDPHIDLKGEDVPDRGVVAIGYAAVTTAGLAKGGGLQESHLAEIVHRHLDDLCNLAEALGVPRERLFTHVGGWKEEELLYNAALNIHSCPGWSFYRHARDARQDRGVQRVLNESDAPYWGAVEWLLMGDHDANTWRESIMNALTIPKCRYLCIYNWSGIRGDRAAVSAIQSVLNPVHAPTPPTGDPK
jgi:hypothetical protein